MLAPSKPQGSSTPVWNVVRTEAHTDVLGFQKHFVATGSNLPANTGGLGAAEGLAQVAYVLAVDEAHTGCDGCGNPVCPSQILTPDVTAQSVLNVVCLRNRIGLILERNETGHGT